MSFQDEHQERMLEFYESFILSCAYKAEARYKGKFGLDKDDFAQEGRMALIKTLKKLDYGHHVNQIDQYLCTRIRGSMDDLVRQVEPSISSTWRIRREEIHVLAWPDPLEHETGSPPETWSPVVDPYPVEDMLDLALALSSVMRRFHNSRDRQIILLAALGYDNIEITRMVGNGNGSYGFKSVGPSRISQIMKASGLFKYSDPDFGGKSKRIKSDISRSTEFQRKKMARDAQA